MLQIILYIIPVFIVYLYIRGCWVANETLKTKYKLARLKDELKWLAISGEVTRDNKVYVHLCNSIDKALVALPRFNFWVMLYLLKREKFQININEIEKMHNEAEKHAMLKEIYDAYYKLIITYIARKNCISVLLSFPPSSLAFYIQNISAKSLLAG